MLAFTPTIDIPLTLLMMLSFLRHFNRWALRTDVETSVDILSVLPSARLRVIFLFACILLLCWYVNLAVWSILALLLGLGLVVAAGTDGVVEPWIVGYLIREWAFGFPELMLHPPTDIAQSSVRHDVTGELVGKNGVVVSPLRPTGDADIDGVKRSVVSFDGRLIEVGSKIKVTSYRSGVPCVAAISEPDEEGEPSHALEPAAGPDSDGQSSRPAQ